MNFIELWIIRRACRKLVVQGPQHRDRIAEFYRVIRRAARREFTEDNTPTLNDFLTECFRDSLEEWE